MPTIRVTEFGGMKPRDVRHFGPPSRAELAKDVKLWHGTLASWRYPGKEIDTNHDYLRTLHKQDCCWLGSEKECVDYVKSDTDCNIIYSTGEMDWPAYAFLPTDCDNCEYQELTWKRVGIPTPVNPPEIVLVAPLTPPVAKPNSNYDTYDCENKVAPKACEATGTEYCDAHGYTLSDPWAGNAAHQPLREPRSYVYSFVNELGEESTMSTPSDVIDSDMNGCVDLVMLIPALPVGFEVTSIRIYRGVPTLGDPDNPTVSKPDGSLFKESVNSTYLYVDEIPFVEGVVPFTDCVPSSDLQESAPIVCATPPPEDLINLTITENGIMVGSVGKKLWFSEPWQFHSWSCYMNLDYCVKAIEFSRNLLYIATNSYPYVVDTAQTTDQECKCCHNITMLSTKAPMTSKLSMVKTGTGVMWATGTGLVKVDGSALQVNSHAFLAEDDWAKYMPHQIKGAYHKGVYYGFNNDKGFMWDVTDGVYSDAYLGDSGRFTELSLRPDSVFVTDQDELYMAIHGDIYRWDSSDTFMPFTWRTKLNVEGGLRNYSCAKIVFEQYLRTRNPSDYVTAKFYVDDKLIFARQVGNSKPFRLPKGFDGLNFQIEISGALEVMEFHMATSLQELTLLNNS